MAEQRIRVKQVSTGQVGTMVRGDPTSFTPDPKRLNPFEEYGRLEEYSPILKAVPWLIGVRGGKTAVETGKTLATGGRFLASSKFRTGLAQKARQTLEEVGQGAGQALETELSQIKGTVNIQPVIQKFVDRFKDVNLQQALGQAISKAAVVGDDTLARFLNQPSLAKSATALDAHRVAISLEQIPEVNSVVTLLRSQVPGKGAKFVQKATPEIVDFLQDATAIRNRIGQVAGGAFQAARGKFGQTARDVRKLTPMFSERHLIQNILTGFGGPFKGGEVRKQVARTLPEATTQQLARVPRGLFGLSLPLLLGAGRRFLQPGRVAEQAVNLP